MYFWMQRCSICLDQTYALCLESCRDQFCKECFARYVEEIVNTSWGLGVTRIKCPVCRETISKSEWSRYVSADIVERYDRYNQPYRSFSRHCLECETAIIPCQGPRLEKISHEGRLELIGRDLSLLPKNEQVIELEAMFEKARLSKRTLRVGQVQELYGQMAPLLKQAGDYELCSGISKQLVSLETLPEAWKQIQFRHVANFPIERCTTCQRTMCLQCGEFGHGGQSCLEYLETQMTGGSEDQLATVQWKLEHTRPCPNCSIMIDRDEGCNKVDCLLCGFRFCWMCGSKWSQVELGVPDMAAIDARRH
ncbi:hypothetical protein CLU79DRAFT_703889 [Phycomyces nitens]|nr:hypothetical protein CLU79DRAFT_703889 [Phycomyces nitens]